MEAMRRVGREVDRLDLRAASHFGIGRTDLHVIETLRTAGPLTPSRLAASVGLTSGGLSIALERLERSGYIRRSRHPVDRRSVVVEATEAIAPLEAEVFGALIERTRALLDTYTREQLESIRDYLDRAATIIGEAGPAGDPTAAKRRSARRVT
jgi:DNA-binding MarR family transcriptional regulator